MVQAARSGRQNIAEGSRASATSSQTELRLVNVARASLDELLLDYEDFLRQRGLPAWSKDDPEAREVRAVGAGRDRTDQSDQTGQTDHRKDYARWLDHHDPAVVANALICLIHQANYLLDRQIQGLEQQFVEGGDYSERLAAPGWRSGEGSRISRIRQIRLIGRREQRQLRLRRPARSAASRWCCARRARDQKLGRSSGVVRGILHAERRLSFEALTNSAKLDPDLPFVLAAYGPVLCGELSKESKNSKHEHCN